MDMDKPFRKSAKSDGEEHWHGTGYGYRRKKCRCQPCKSAYSEEMREWWRSRPKRDPRPEDHGKTRGYSYYGCRCSRCRETIRWSWIKQKYGLSEDGYLSLLGSQNGACAICRKPFGDAVPNVDHDHSTGLVRGLLCTVCNTGVGKLGDSVEGLTAALRYLANGEVGEVTSTLM